MPSIGLNGHAIFTPLSLSGTAERTFIVLPVLEVSMERGLLAPLSPNEHAALRRVAGGISKPKHLRPSSVARLKRLALVEENEGRIRLTALGKERWEADSRPGTGAEAP
jgi:hypothetical protein